MRIRALMGAAAVLWAVTVSAETVFTGDMIQGAPVISQLDLTDLAPADGRVAIVGTDAATERGTEIATLLVKRASCAGGACDFGGIVP